MTDPLHTEPVEVTQADREAAWPFADFHCLPDKQMRERWFSGYYDNLPQGGAIQAFARHRTAAAEAAFRAREARLREALEAIRRWAENAYGTDIFEEPDLEAVNRVLTENGLRGHMDRMHASWGRHLMKGVGSIARAALSPAAKGGEA